MGFRFGRDGPTEIISLMASNQAALVRLDLPAGENLSTPPLSAQILLATSETNPVSADFLDTMPGVDPQFQGQSYLFLVNGQSLPPNAAVSGFLKIPGEPLTGRDDSRHGNSPLRRPGLGL